MIRVTNLRHWFDPGSREPDDLVELGLSTCAADLAPDWALAGKPDSFCSRNGVKVTGEDWNRRLADGDHLVFAFIPGASITAAASATATGLGLTGTSTAAFSFAAVFKFVALNASLIVLQRLLQPSLKPIEGRDDSATFAFSALQSNEKAEGAAIPVVYGAPRHAPPIINQSVRNFLDTDGKPRSELQILLLVGEGPVQEICGKTEDGGPFTLAAGNFVEGLQIQNQPAENFSEVEVHVRMGSLDQTPIPGFSEPTLTFGVAFTLRESDVNVPPTTVEATPGGQVDPADGEITKWDNEGAFTTGDVADEFTVGLLFPQGLFRISSTGDAVNASVQVQIRYRLADSGGTPFGDYVILPPSPIATASRQGPFRVEYRHPIIDPADYGAPTLGKKLVLPSGHGGTSYSAIDATNIPVFAPQDVEFSWTGWLDLQGNTNATFFVFDWLDTPNLEGFDFRIVVAATAANITAKFRLASGSTQTDIDAVVGGYTPGFHYWALTYKASSEPGGVNGRVRMYLDGILVKASIITPAQGGVFDLAEPITIGSNIGGTDEFIGEFDEFAFYHRELGGFEISEKFNGGPPNDIAAGDPNELGLTIGFRFDTEFANLGLRFSPEVFGPGQNAALLGLFLGSDPAGGSDPTISTADGVVTTPTAGTRIQSRLLIEVHRITAETTLAGEFDEVQFETVKLRTFLAFEFPGMALLGVFIPAQDQLNTSQPLVTVAVKGRLCPIWDGVDPVFPNLVPTFTQNPWWILLDAALDLNFGGGAYFTTRKLVLPQIKAAADFADELIVDGGETLSMLRVLKVDSTGAGVADWPVGYIEFGVDGDSALPANFVPPTEGVVSTGVSLNATGTGASPAEPAWFTAHKDADATEIREVIFIEGPPALYLIRCDQQAGTDTTEGVYTPAAGDLIMEVFEPRYQFDGVYDRRDFALWDALVQIAQTARGVPLLQGARLGAFYDHARSPVGYLNMASIVEGSFAASFSGQRNRPNVEEVEFFDRLRSFERSNETIEHPSFTDPTQADARRPRRIRLEGITRRSQVRRHARQDLDVFNLLRRSVRVATAIDTLSFLPGDVIEASHDVPPYGESGMVFEDSTATDEIKLDREIVIAVAATYEILCQSAAANLAETVAVDTTATPPATYPAGSTIFLESGGFTFQPSKDDKYGFGETGSGLVGASKQFTITSIDFDPTTLQRKVELLEYDPQVYTPTFGTLPEISEAQFPAGSDSDIPQGVEEPRIIEQAFTDADGGIRISIEVSFVHPEGTRHAVAGTRIYVTDNSRSSGLAGALQVANLPANQTFFRIDGYRFRPDTTYTITIEPFNRFSAGRYRSVGTSLEFVPVGIPPSLAAPTNLGARIAGKRLFLNWDGEAHELARSVECRMGGWVLGTRLGSSPGGSGQLVIESFASGPANVEGQQAPTLFVRSKNQAGQYGDASQIVFDAEVVDAKDILIEISEEDLWDGTRVNLDIVSGPLQKQPVQIGERGDRLKFAGSSLVGTYTVNIEALNGAQDVFAQIIVEATQIHPLTWDEAEFMWDDFSEGRRSWEGPTWTKPGETPNATVEIQFDHGEQATPPGDLRRFLSGPYYLRSGQVRVILTRPTDEYDIEMTRLAIRMTKIPTVPHNPIEIEVFS